MCQSVELSVPTTAEAASAAWDLFLLHGDAAYSLCRLLGADDSEAGDVLEDVFVGLGRWEAHRDTGTAATAAAGAGAVDRAPEDRRLEVLAQVCHRLSTPSIPPPRKVETVTTLRSASAQGR